MQKIKKLNLKQILLRFPNIKIIKTSPTNKKKFNLSFFKQI
jgi:hypothetical protein